MAMDWLGDIEQLARIEQAEAVAAQFLQPEYDEVNDLYETHDFDMRAALTLLRDVAAAARQARVDVSTTQAVVEIEYAEERSQVERARKYLNKGRSFVKFALMKKHPLADGLDRLLVKEFAAESYRDSTDFVANVLGRLTHSTRFTQGLTGDLTPFGLPASFVAEGQAIFADLKRDRDEANAAAGARTFYVTKLHALLDQIKATFEEMNTAKDYVEAMTGRELPDFDLTIARAAAAPTRSADAAAAADTDAPGL